MSHYIRRGASRSGFDSLVLIIEDDSSLRNNLAYLFEAEHMCAMTAADGMSGLALMRQYRPRVVIVDMYLPHVSGFELVDDLRSDPTLEGVFVIAITGMAEDEEDLRGMRGSADLIMAKPLDERRLLDLVRAALATDPQPSGLRRRSAF